MLTHYRDAHRPESVEPTAEHVRDHLASLADPDDDPATYRDQVRLDTQPLDSDVVRITGTLDQPSRAPYLAEGYDPDDTDAQPPRYTIDGPLPGADAAPIDQQSDREWAR